ncbi:MAG: lipid A phosphoethanolamine transferase [Paraprevotella sp.]|uniref:phosphoethanolamine transferase n=1 Tax=Paraprevotella sp. TaxID=2049036 RepID=UPI0025809A69|nr:phosphoethanolamine transferase [Paraprevotella sp.]MBS4809103.1 lipid A phosphoethanolamine transferase [Paraprevotella sp.]
MKLFNKTNLNVADVRMMYVSFIIVLTLPNIMLSMTDQMPVIWRVCNIIFPVMLYWCTLSLSRKTGKMIWIMFPLVFLAAFQLVLLYIFGQSIISVDMFLNLLTTNVAEAGEVLTNIIPAIIAVFVIYVPFLIWGTVAWMKKYQLTSHFIKRQRKLSLCGIMVSIILMVFAICKYNKHSLLNDIYPLNVFNNIYLAINRTYLSNHYKELSRNFMFSASTERIGTAEVHIMVIGETARACNWGIYGYVRNTTPNLTDTKGLIAFSDVLTQSNTTHKSVPMLLSAANADNYESIYRQKSIITAFREAGFHTMFISNQRPNHSLIDFFGMEADTCVFLKEADPKTEHYDIDLLKHVKAAIQSNHKKLFIVLHSYGSHYNYHERYEKGKGIYLPDTPYEAKYENKEYLMNAYDNTILCTDEFLSSLISTLESSNTLSSLLYVSDHGEDIFDDRRRLFLHASPQPSYFQLHVPFIVWISESFRNNEVNTYDALLKNRNKPIESSVCAFHTMLFLGGICTPFGNEKYSVTSANLYKANRKYLNDHNKGIVINEIITDKEDIEAFSQHNVIYK